MRPFPTFSASYERVPLYLRPTYDYLEQFSQAFFRQRILYSFNPIRKLGLKTQSELALVEMPRAVLSNTGDQIGKIAKTIFKIGEAVTKSQSKNSQARPKILLAKP